MSEGGWDRGLVNVVRFLAVTVSLYFIANLTLTVLAGRMVLSREWPFYDTVPLSSPAELLAGYVMWGTFFLGMFLAGAKPSLFRTHRWLGPLLLAILLLAFVAVSLLIGE